jgi:hydrogenase/urease accessory protein HupE
MRMRARHPWRIVASSALGVLLCASRALAHLMPAQQGTLNIVGNAVFAALSIPLSALTGADDNGDGRLSQRELDAHVSDVQRQLGARFQFFNATQHGRLDLVMPMVEPDERDSTSLAGSTHVLVLMKSTFDVPPTALRVTTDLFGPAANERQLTLKATRGADIEAVVLTPARSTHAFFRAPWAVLGDYVGLGVTHVLGGVDHLLFLLTIIVAAAGWRYWASVLTSFTIAHSITLTLSLLGVIRVPATVVEPLIAASIVVMALLNLRQRNAPAALGPRVAIVFACGLLHGLGFASAMAAMGLHGAYRVVSLVGFNVGIELGQAMFLCAALLAGIAWRHVRSEWGRPFTMSTAAWAPPMAFPRSVSWVAAGLGALWFVQRLVVAVPLMTRTATPIG